MGMDYNKTYNKILTDEEFMEIKPHGSSAYPFQYYYDNLELFDFHCIEWHWHREFEFLYVESGQVTCGIGEKLNENLLGVKPRIFASVVAA